jgi:uncharacterized protein (TIGR03118 family)
MASKHIALALFMTASFPAIAGTVSQTNLVSDGVTPAAVTDPNLKNPWGISYSPTGAFWVSDNATGLTTLYDGTGAIQNLVVTIPAASGSGTGSPTGQVFNGSSDFTITEGGKSGTAAFIFATEDGTISGWSFSVDPANAVVAVNQSAQGAVYKGIALYTDSKGNNSLYVTDFHGGNIDVFDGTFKPTASFRDTTLPANYSPYNVAILNGNIYVTYAVVDKQRHDSVSGKGKGILEEISPTGQVLARFEHGQLNAPWGLAIAPAGWGKLTGDILVGNFGNGEIAVYTPTLKAHGVLKTAAGKPLAIDGLWGLIPGNGGSGGATNTLYFSAGTNAEVDGLFGALTYTP